MAKDPAFLFYPADWIGGTMGMTFEEKGAYVELLMLQFNRGHMTKDMIGQTIGHLWGRIESKFVKDDNDLWFNERLDLEKEKRKSFVKSRANNKSGQNQHTKNNKKEVGHMSNHMVNVNVNENIDTKLKGGKGENLDSKIKKIFEPLEISLEIKLPPFVQEAAERNQFTHTKSSNTDFILASWKIFLSERMGDPPEKKAQYIQITDLTSYFLNWIRNKFPKNETNKRNSNGRPVATIIPEDSFGEL